MSPLEFLNYTLTYIATSSGEHIYKVTRVLLVRTRQDRVGDEEEAEEEEEEEKAEEEEESVDEDEDEGNVRFSVRLPAFFFSFHRGHEHSSPPLFG